MFRIAEIVILCLFLYLLINLIRFAFYKESKGGGLFGISDSWIKNEKKKGK